MSKKRGLSADEKREKLLEMFRETADFFQLKDVEKLGSKKGIITQTIKDVLQSLLDDDLVQTDKIGTCRYFWALPSTASAQMGNAVTKMEAQLEALKQRRVQLGEQKTSMMAMRKETAARQAALSKLAAFQAQYKKQQEELMQFADMDPETVDQMRNATKVAKDAANRWTDNIFAVQRWCMDKFPNVTEGLEQLNKEVGITDEFDYV